MAISKTSIAIKWSVEINYITFTPRTLLKRTDSCRYSVIVQDQIAICWHI